jgi:membrane protein
MSLLVSRAHVAIKGYGRHQCPQLAAAISYHVLFSIFPLALVIAAITGLVLQDDSLRQRVTDNLIDALPLTAHANGQLSDAIKGASAPSAAVGLIGIVGLIWSAAGMMASIRIGLTAAWGRGRRQYVRGKLVDLVMLTGVGLLVLITVGITVLQQLLPRLGRGLGYGLLDDMVSIGLGFGVSLLLFSALYRLVPPGRPRLASVLPAAAMAAVGLELLKQGYALYLANFADYSVVYGSLGAVIAFLFFVYLAASLLLFGAELGAAFEEEIPLTPE